jgi:hypothetical protein
MKALTKSSTVFCVTNGKDIYLQRSAFLSGLLTKLMLCVFINLHCLCFSMTSSFQQTRIKDLLLGLFAKLMNRRPASSRRLFSSLFLHPFSSLFLHPFSSLFLHPFSSLLSDFSRWLFLDVQNRTVVIFDGASVRILHIYRQICDFQSIDKSADRLHISC